MAAAVGQTPNVDILSVSAIPALELTLMEPDAPVETSDGVDPDRTLWLVKASGLFVTFRVAARAR
jgi:hypothetical protein